MLKQDRPPGSRVTVDTPVGFALAIPITVLVPDLSGRTEPEARDLLTKARLRAGDVGSNEDRRPQGTVISQNPAANTQVVIGTAVALVTAKPVLVAVPRVVDLSEERARQRLAEVELGAGTIEHRESAGTPGTVLAQSINPDERMPLGTLVNLVVSAIETVPVPSFVGVPIEQARRTLLENRLGVGEQPRATNVEAPGTVVAQGHLPGARVAVGTAIVLTVAVPLVVTVPPVVGLPHDAAAAAMTAAGLEVGTIGLRLSLQAGGTVLMQATAPGAQVPFGTRVALDEARPRVVWLAPLVLLLLTATAGLAKARTGRKRPSEDRTPPLDFSVRPQVDAGDAHVAPDAKRPVGREVRIQPVTDGGYQDLSAAAGDLIRSEKKEVL